MGFHDATLEKMEDPVNSTSTVNTLRLVRTICLHNPSIEEADKKPCLISAGFLHILASYNVLDSLSDLIDEFPPPP